MLNTRTGLVPPYTGNAGDGFAESEEPVAGDSMLNDAICYIVEGLDGEELRRAVNTRNGFPGWKIVDATIEQARPLATLEVEKRRKEQAARKERQRRFENLSALFSALDLRIQTNDNGYDLLGLTESQAVLCAKVLAREGTP
jgi:hypothetical protein